MSIEKLAYRPSEAIEATGIKRSHLYELMAAGELESFKIGRARLITRASLEALIERRRAEAQA